MFGVSKMSFEGRSGQEILFRPMPGILITRQNKDAIPNSSKYRIIFYEERRVLASFKIQWKIQKV